MIALHDDARHLAMYGGALAIVGLWLISRLSRWSSYNSVHRRFKGKYALNAADDAKGLQRMNKSGYRGVRDAQYILRQVTTREMPFLYQKALEYALFRTYGIPTISKILAKTGNFVQAEKSSRRYIDTQLLIVSFLFYPLPRLDLEDNDAGHGRPDEDVIFEQGGDDDPRSAIALARVNFLHRRANKIHGPSGAGISNEDLLYTLTVFITQPIKWVELFAWRGLSPLEKEALFTVMYHVGRCMRIEGVPDTLDSLNQWAEDFERRRMVFAPVNHTVAVETVNLLLWAVPPFMRPLFFPVIASLMDDRLIKAVGFTKPPAFVSLLPYSLLYSMLVFQRFFSWPRRKYHVVAPYDGDGTPQLSGKAALIDEKNTPAPASCPFGASSARPRNVPKWYENDPHYSLPAPTLSARWIYERLLVPAGSRYGAPKWQRSVVRTADTKHEPSRMACPAGYRLEECGPRGIEDVGHDEVRQEAEQLHGKPLRGKWAF